MNYRVFLYYKYWKGGGMVDARDSQNDKVQLSAPRTFKFDK